MPDLGFDLGEPVGCNVPRINLP